MDELYRDTRRLIVECRNMHEALEHASTNRQLDPLASRSVAERFHETVNVVEGRGAELRRELIREPPSRRQVWKARLKDLDDQVSELRAFESTCASKLRSIAREQQMRDDLLQRRHARLNPSDGHSYSVAMHDGVGSATLRAAEEAGRLDHSGSVVGNIINTGRDALTSLTAQKERLHGARRKVLDVLHQIGVDRQIIARIERRERSDMILVYGLMIAMLILLGLAVLWKYHRRRLVA